MLMPKKTKYRKSHKAKRGGVATRGTTVGFGSYGKRPRQLAGLLPGKLKPLVGLLPVMSRELASCGLGFSLTGR